MLLRSGALAIVLFASVFSLDALRPSSAASGRDVLKQPFASSSIWNMPIRSNAVYVPAQIPRATEPLALTVDPDILVLRPQAPLTAVYSNDDGWSGGDRCTPGAYLYSVPVPGDFAVPGASPSSTPNYAAAILLPDGRTLRQGQPFTRCVAGGPATTEFTVPDVDIYGDGIRGAHGGSGLSSIGGTLRLGELVPGGVIAHALKINLQASVSLSPVDGGYRWPASQADWCAPGCYGGAVQALRMGSLLALPPSVDIDQMGLETQPAKMLAWTLQNYGGYVADDTGWSVYAIEVEHSPDGEVEDEFQARWGFSMTSSKASAWGRDMDRIFGALAVVDNNGPSSIGGGGTPRQPLAPPVAPTSTNPGPDSDGDGCPDANETSTDPLLGGRRDPNDPWDFFDVTGDQFIDLSDAIDVMSYFGDPALPGTPGNLRDRYVPDPAQPWRTAESDDGVDLSDALYNLASFGTNCSAAP